MTIITSKEKHDNTELGKKHSVITTEGDMQNHKK